MRERLMHPATWIATLALLVALGGAGYAVTALPKGSVGTAQLKKNAVTSAKVKDGSLLAADFKGGQLPRGATGPRGERGPAGPAEGAAGGALTGAYPNPALAAKAVGATNLAPDALGTGRMYNPLTSCSPLEGDTTAQTVIYTLGGVYSSSGSLLCDLDGLPAGAVVDEVVVRVSDTGATNMSAAFFNFPAVDNLGGRDFGTKSTTGVGGAQTLTITPTSAAPINAQNSYVLFLDNTSSTTRLLWYQVRYRLAD